MAERFVFIPPVKRFCTVVPVSNHIVHVANYHAVVGKVQKLCLLRMDRCQSAGPLHEKPDDERCRKKGCQRYDVLLGIYPEDDQSTVLLQ